MSQTQKISKNNTKVNIVRSDEGTSITVKLYNTVVFEKKPNGCIVLRTGGYRTATTRARINQAFKQFGLPYSVYQQDYSWFVRNTDTGAEMSFIDSELEFFCAYRSNVEAVRS